MGRREPVRWGCFAVAGLPWTRPEDSCRLCAARPPCPVPASLCEGEAGQGELGAGVAKGREARPRSPRLASPLGTGHTPVMLRREATTASILEEMRARWPPLPARGREPCPGRRRPSPAIRLRAALRVGVPDSGAAQPLAKMEECWAARNGARATRVTALPGVHGHRVSGLSRAAVSVFTAAPAPRSPVRHEGGTRTTAQGLFFCP